MMVMHALENPTRQLVNRLKPIFNSLIMLFFYAFVKGILILDNLLNAHELFQGKRWFAAFKIGLNKRIMLMIM